MDQWLAATACARVSALAGPSFLWLTHFHKARRRPVSWRPLRASQFDASHSASFSATQMQSTRRLPCAAHIQLSQWPLRRTPRRWAGEGEMGRPASALAAGPRSLHAPNENTESPLVRNAVAGHKGTESVDAEKRCVSRNARKERGMWIC